jgi:hypothetical protein
LRYGRYKLFTKPLNAVKATSAKWLETNPS